MDEMCNIDDSSKMQHEVPPKETTLEDVMKAVQLLTLNVKELEKKVVVCFYSFSVTFTFHMTYILIVECCFFTCAEH